MRLLTPDLSEPRIERPVPPPIPVAGPGTRGALELMLGVVLPAAALVIEMASGMSADAYLNPLPNWRALILAWVVPIANFVGWLGPGFSPARWRGYLSGLAVVVASIYGIAYLPIAPFAILAILAVGIGLLPLSPFGAVFTALRQLRDITGEPGAPSLLRALGLASAIVLGAAAPSVWTHFLLDRAIHGTPEQQARAVDWLRATGDRQYLREAGDDRRPAGWFGRSPDQVKVPKVYYLVTGEPLGNAPRNRRGWLDIDFDWDEEQGQDRVGRLLKGLSVSSSRLEGRITPRAGIHYQEWTLEFRNTENVQREARAVIALPQDGVVSRVTLWIDGEEREAAFGGRSQTKAAYQSVVSVRRDPLLVQSAGPGRVLAQCFPIPPRGSMKIRLGISAPVRDGQVQLPYFVDRNFSVDGVNHSVWIDGGADPFSRGLAETAMSAPLAIRVADPAEVAWTPHPLDKSRVIVQRQANGQPLPERLAVVVDGSKSMAGLAEPIRAALARQAKRHPNWRLIETGNFRGGSDNVAVLQTAQDQLASMGGGTILWLHGPQPVELTSAEVLRAHLERKKSRVELVAAQLVPGPDVVTPKLDGIATVRALRAGASDWPDRLGESGGVIREAIPAAEKPEGFEAPMDLARLWASAEIPHLLPRDAKAATQLGAGLRMVTPASGAVVLENQSQYQAFGLDPDKGLTNVPEPGTMLLVGGSLVVLCVLQKRKKRNDTN